MATGAVLAAACDQHNDNNHHDEESDEPQHYHPPWCRGALGARGTRRFGHVSFLHSEVTLCNDPKFTRHCVYVKSQ